MDFPHTHNLAKLRLLSSAAGGDAPVSEVDAAYLQPWAVELRYDASGGPVLDRPRALELASSAVDWANRQIRDLS